MDKPKSTIQITSKSVADKKPKGSTKVVGSKPKEPKGQQITIWIGDEKRRQAAHAVDGWWKASAGSQEKRRRATDQIVYSKSIL